MSIEALEKAWQDAKALELAAQARRREIEDELVKLHRVDVAKEGTVTAGGMKVSVRLNRKIDADKLQDIAQAHGLTDHLAVLFRWKPEVITSQWKSAHPDITRPLLDAITTTPGRPTFALAPTKKDTNNG